MEPTKILPIVAVPSLVSVEYGGWALLTYISGRAGLADWQKGFFRAGHARGRAPRAFARLPALPATRRLLQRVRMDRRERADRRGARAIGGFFLHRGVGQAGKPSAGTKLTRIGAFLIGAALVSLAVGSIQTA